MSPQTIVFALVTFLHDLFTATWIGGLIVFGITVLPSVKQSLGAGPQTKKVMATIQKRHSTWVYISMVGLVLTGVLMAKRNPDFGSLFSFATAYGAALSIKHILVLGMIAITLYRSVVLGKEGKANTPQKEKLNGLLLLVNLVLGMAVLLVTGFAVAVG
jgi:putative copper export protein